MALAKRRLIAAYLLSLMLLVCVGTFTVYAAEGEAGTPIYEDAAAISAVNNSMIVNSSWLDGEMLRIDVADAITGAVSSLAVRLSDFISNADAQNSRYIMIQAADMDGNLSGIIQISNPFYVPASTDGSENANNNQPRGAADPSVSGSNENSGNNAGDAEPPQLGLTPDGTGTVIDNMVTQNEIEFFTVYTEEGNVFFLVVDRQRSSDNVYLLNAVTEADLIALAEQGGTPVNSGISAIPAPPPIEPPADGQNQPPLSTQSPPDPGADEETPPARGGNNNLIFIAIVVVAVGGAAYYFKIVKGRKSSSDDDWEYEGDEDDYSDSENTDEGGGDE